MFPFVDLIFIVFSSAFHSPPCSISSQYTLRDSVRISAYSNYQSSSPPAFVQLSILVSYTYSPSLVTT
jgi:hypothetical protein